MCQLCLAGLFSAASSSTLATTQAQLAEQGRNTPRLAILDTQDNYVAAILLLNYPLRAAADPRRFGAVDLVGGVRG